MQSHKTLFITILFIFFIQHVPLHAQDDFMPLFEEATSLRNQTSEHQLQTKRINYLQLTQSARIAKTALPTEMQFNLFSRKFSMVFLQ